MPHQGGSRRTARRRSFIDPADEWPLVARGGHSGCRLFRPDDFVPGFPCQGEMSDYLVITTADFTGPA
eukprot:6677401-Heterocapsa_arctica.AAC.1